MLELDLSALYSQMGRDLGSMLGLIIIAVAGLVIVTWDCFRNNAPELPWVAVGSLALAFVAELFMLGSAGTVFMDTMRVGGFAAFVNLIVIGATLMSVLLSKDYLTSIGQNQGETYAIMLFAAVGMMVLGSANHLTMVFVGLETMSISLYILTGLVRDARATESALKYFLLGAFATGFFLYGIALMYGATGTMYLPELGVNLALTGNTELFWGGVGLLLIGFFFKVSAVPFHMWTPDFYQGAPTTLTGFMSTASKAAAFASLILILYFALPVDRAQLALAVVALVTMVLGNVMALAQDNVKRMLAYSSVAHAGYVLVGLAAGTAAGYSGALFYLLVYSLMNIGAFGVIALLEWDGAEGATQTLDSLSGVGHRKPLLGVTMGLFMFSLIGFPGLGGFWGKYAVFAPAVQSGLVWLVIVGVLASAVSAFYYLRVLYVMWMKADADVPEADRSAVSGSRFPVPTASAVVLVTCAALLVVLGLFPGLLSLTEGFFALAEGVAATP
jgi:NADH-quinone oxidoreductase subunit N